MNNYLGASYERIIYKLFILFFFLCFALLDLMNWERYGKKGEKNSSFNPAVDAMNFWGKEKNYANADKNTDDDDDDDGCEPRTRNGWEEWSCYRARPKYLNIEL